VPLAANTPKIAAIAFLILPPASPEAPFSMSVTATTAPSVPDHRAQFLNLLETGLAQNSFIKLVLAKYVGPEAELQRIIIKQVTVKDQPCLSFVYRYKTRDITKNFPLEEAVANIAGLLPQAFKNAHLLTLTDEVQLEYSKKGKSSLFKGKSQQERELPSAEHNREKIALWTCLARFWRTWGSPTSSRN
jgi:hypothetical protein